MYHEKLFFKKNKKTNSAKLPEIPNVLVVSNKIVKMMTFPRDIIFTPFNINTNVKT